MGGVDPNTLNLNSTSTGQPQMNDPNFMMYYPPNMYPNQMGGQNNQNN